MSEEVEPQRFITDLVAEKWKSSGVVFLLSALGPFLKKQYPNLNVKEYGGLQGLCESITTLKVVRHPESEPKIGVVPADAVISGDIRRIFQSVSNDPRIVLYSDDFWQAFTRKTANPRFINILADQTFSVTEIPFQSAISSYEILQSDFPDVSVDMTIEQKVFNTHKKVNNWLERNEIADADLIFGKKPFIDNKHVKGSTGNIFLDTFSALNDEELRRLSIPADIILKLFGRR